MPSRCVPQAFRVWLALAAFVLVATEAQQTGAGEVEPADLIVQAGRIWTGDAANPWAEALAIRDGVIVEVGQAEAMAPHRGPMTRELAYPDGFAAPGLIDAHGHLASLGKEAEQLDLRDAASLDEVRARLAAYLEAHPGDFWALGRGWDQSLWPGGAFPTAADLDDVAPSRPVWLTRVDGHAAWANSEALRRAGIVADTKAPAGGQIVRDQGGQPTGVLVDSAMGLVSRVIPRDTEEDIERHILAGQDICLRNGLTGVHDAGESALDVALFRRLDREGRLKLRVYGMARPPEGGEVAFASQPPATSKGPGRYELRAIKLFADGAMGSRGALVFEPYADDPSHHGQALIDQDVLRQTTEAALRHGWQVCTHAIGDKGNAMVLDAYESALRAVPEARDARLRIEHAQVVRREDVARFARGGIIASMQPSHASTDMRWADARLGAGSLRVQGAYAWRWFLNEGVPLAFGSDFPVEVPSPFWGLYAAVTRRDAEGKPPGGWHPDQALHLEEALRAFTTGAAFAGFAEGRVGVLRVGMRGDLTVVDRDLARVAPEVLLETQVITTIIDGEVIHSLKK